MHVLTGFEEVDAAAQRRPGGLLGQAVESIDLLLKQKRVTPNICDLAHSARVAICSAAGGGGSPVDNAAWPLPAESPVAPWRVETADGVPGYDVVSADGTLDDHFDDERDAQRRADALNERDGVPA